MREIQVSEITKTVRQMCMDAAYHLPKDIYEGLKKGRETEESPVGCIVLDQIIKNAEIADAEDRPYCQDTGMTLVFVEVGQDVHFVGGADAVIAEGMEAGGHIGKLTTMTLVRQVVEAVSIPVIGAGGVADGAGAAAVFMLGAEAVQVGTRFVVAKESNAHQNFKDKILKAKDIDTVVSASVVGHPVRAIKNKLATEYNQAEKDFLAGKKTQEEIEELGAGALRNAVVDGDVEYGSVMAGQIAGLVRKEETCAEILEDLYTGAAKVIKEEAARWADVNV